MHVNRQMFEHETTIKLQNTKKKNEQFEENGSTKRLRAARQTKQLTRNEKKKHKFQVKIKKTCDGHKWTC